MFKRLIYKESGQEHGKIKITDRKTNEATVRWFGEKYLMIILLGAYILLTWIPLSNAKAYAQDNPKKKVLVLNSYHRAFQWTDRIIRGISSVLETEEQDIEIYIEDMDSKRFSSKAYIRELQHIYSLKFSGLKFDVIISSDDNAFHFLLRNHNDLFANTPVVFCGVNFFKDSMLKGNKLFTGVVEATDIKSNIELILKLHPETKSIAVITNNTTAGESTRKVLEQVSKDYSGITEIISLDGSKITRAEIFQKLQDLPKGSQVLLLNYHRDKSNRFIPYTRFIPILSAGIKSPLYCASGNFLGHGTVGGMLNSAFYQGEAAGKMARLILQGEDVADIPVLKESPNRYMFDYKQMQRFGIKLSNLPERSFVINRPCSFYTDHKDMFWVVAASISILSLIIIVLGFNISTRKKAGQKLMKYQNNLEEIIKERTSELRYSETKLTNLIETVPIGISISSPGAKGSFTEINLTLCRIFGYNSKIDFFKMPASAHYYRPQERESFSELCEQGPVSNYETRFKRKDGSVFWGSVSSVPQTTETGTIQFINIFQDISERRKVEEALLKSEFTVKSILKAAPVGIGLVCDRTLREVNDKLCELVGYSSEELLDKNSRMLYPTVEDYNYVGQEKYNQIRENGIGTVETRWQRKDGTMIYVLLSSAPIDLHNLSKGLTFTALDISGQKMAEAKLRESKKRYEIATNAGKVGVWDWDIESNEIFLDPNLKAMLGYEDHEILNQMDDWVKFVYPDDLERVMAQADAHLEGKAPQYEIAHRMLHKDGSFRWFLARGNAFRNASGKPYRMIGTDVDITLQKEAEKTLLKNRDELEQRVEERTAELTKRNEQLMQEIKTRKQAEEALQESEERYRSLTDNLPVAIYRNTPDPEGQFIMVNPAFCKMFGFKNEEEVKDSTPAGLYQNSKERKEYSDNLIQKGVIENDERTLLKRDGTPVNTSITASVVYGKDGEVSHFDSIMLDITDRKLAEEQSLKNKKMLQAVFDGISDPLMMVNKDMKLLLQNKAAMKYYGVPYTANCLNKECHQVFNGNPSPCEGCNIPSAVSNGRHESFERKGFMDPERLEQIIIYPINHRENQEMAAIIRISDVTRERQMERELIQADKMISLGVLVSGVAHEINNPNNFIMLNTPLLREAWESIVPVLERYYEENGDFSMGGLPYSEMRDDVPKLFSGIREGSERIKQIVQDLKDFARHDGADMYQSVNINQIIKSSIRLTSNLIKKTTENIRIEYGRNLPSFKGNKQKLEQVMINLIQNACQALPDKEKGIFITSFFDKERDSVVVEVRDEGEGIPEYLLPRIMDPFFTTRRSEGGTGLGLSVSSNILKGHWGKIEVESEWGKGTTFRFFIPTTRIEEPVKILVTDDDSTIREFITAALEKPGIYSVREASNGAEAFLKIGQEPPDLLILDVQMPDMDGVEVCRLINEKPELSDIKVIIITGFAESSRVKEIARMGFDKILAKPFSIPAFLNMVDEVLEVQK